MGVKKKTRKFAQVDGDYQEHALQIVTYNSLKVKRIIGQRDARLKKNQDKAVIQNKRKSKDELVREMSVCTASRHVPVFNASDLKFPHLSSFNTTPVRILSFTSYLVSVFRDQSIE